MNLESSCDCGAVMFEVDSAQPCRFIRCYCSALPEDGGRRRYAVNPGGDAKALKGKRHLHAYKAQVRDGSNDIQVSTAQRHFCGRCGSALLPYDPTWPKVVHSHSHASAIDAPLPRAPENVHIMLRSKVSCVQPESKAGDARFDGYPDVSLAQWHEARGL